MQMLREHVRERKGGVSLPHMHRPGNKAGIHLKEQSVCFLPHGSTKSTIPADHHLDDSQSSGSVCIMLSSVYFVARLYLSLPDDTALYLVFARQAEISRYGVIPGNIAASQTLTNEGFLLILEISCSDKFVMS
jgi:hypothetical protein